MNQLTAGRIAKHLRMHVRYEGRVMTNGDLYAQVIGKGFTQPKHFAYDDGTHCYRLADADGVMIEIPKMIYDNPESIGLSPYVEG
jgi:hypothetical protein